MKAFVIGNYAVTNECHPYSGSEQDQPDHVPAPYFFLDFRLIRLACPLTLMVRNPAAFFNLILRVCGLVIGFLAFVAIANAPTKDNELKLSDF
jgi:hypothetical protein